MSGTSKKVLGLVEAHRLSLVSDQELLERFAADRDEAAFALVVRRHGPMVLGVCRRVLGHEQDAEDAFQAAFLILAQKAGTIRESDVGGFLYGVAYHLAVRAGSRAARIRRRDREGGAMGRDEARTEAAWQEVYPLVDEEMQRLPEELRSALVLCYLEGKTLDEAARHLGWSKSTLRRRLNRGRELLRSRLVARGLAPTAALAATLFAEGKMAAVSPVLAGATVRSAVDARAISPTVAALVEAGSALLAVGKTKAATALVLALGLLAGLSVWMGRALTPPAAAQPSAPAPKADPPAKKNDSEKPLVIGGRVVGPDGKPMARARVAIDLTAIPPEALVRKPLASATTDADGNFSLAVDRARLFYPQPRLPLKRVVVLATAAGCGPDWQQVPLAEAGKEVTLRLVKDDVPIEGRILTLEGKPVAGVKVRLNSIRAFPRGDLMRAVRAERDGAQMDTVTDVRWLSPSREEPTWVVRTDARGRFRLSGIGRERIAELNLEGVGIQHTSILVMTRAGEAPSGTGPRTIYPATFEYLAQPSRLIRGTVREKGTGKPIAGVKISGHASTAQVWTDARGRFELPGCPKGPSYGVYAFPARGQPYFLASVSIKDTEGLGPMTADLEMTGGIPFEGKVLDGVTGKPVSGGVGYYPLYPNRNVQGNLGPGHGGGMGPWSESAIGPDGSFRCLVLPGPGCLAIHADVKRYVSACVDESTVGAYGGNRDILGIPVEGDTIMGIPQEQYQAIHLIKPDRDSKSLSAVIRLPVAAVIHGTVVDAEGKPITGVRVRGQQTSWSWGTLETAEFHVYGVNPLRPRRLYFVDTARKRIGSLEVKGTEKDALKVRMQPWAGVCGRLVDAEGRPVANAELEGGPFVAEKGRTDKAGRFRVEGFIPGLSSHLSYEKTKPHAAGEVLEGFVGKPGEVRDLGEVRGKPFRQN